MAARFNTDFPAASRPSPSGCALTEGTQDGNEPSGSRAPRRKALLVGCQYFDGATLNGPHYDVRCMAHLLISRAGYAKDDIVILTDQVYYEHEALSVFPGEAIELPEREDPPTKSKIEDRIQNWLMKDVQRGDYLFFHFSGHGGTRKRRNKQMQYIKAAYPKKGAQIWDEDLHNMLVAPLPVGAHMHVFLDSCFSSGALDLGHIVNFAAKERMEQLATTGKEAWRLDQPAQEEADRAPTGRVVQFSACFETQESREVPFDLRQLPAHLGLVRNKHVRPGIATYLFIHAVMELSGTGSTPADSRAQVESQGLPGMDGSASSNLTYQNVMTTMKQKLAGLLSSRTFESSQLSLRNEIGKVFNVKIWRFQELQLGSTEPFNLDDRMIL